MKYFILLSFFSILLPLQSNGNQEESVLIGNISHLSSLNVYVRFQSSFNVASGDTLYLKSNEDWIPALVVSQQSAISCVGKPITDRSLHIADLLYVMIPSENKGLGKIIQDSTRTVSSNVISINDSPEIDKPDKGRAQEIKGRIRLSSYSNYSNTDLENRQKLRYTFSLSANNIAGSRLSVETYTSFTHELGNWDEIKENVFSAMKIYNLALRYDAGENTKLWLGRKINPKLSHIGAVDGLMAETKIKNFSFGGVLGTRPDFSDYSINLNLLEYGAYVGHSVSTRKGLVQSSVAMFEQRNGGNVDRRFAYFQHSSSLLKNLYLFTSSELELYRIEEGKASTSPSMTSLYFSLRYKLFKKLTLFASYDARKNVIYYESFKDYADRLLEEATRQGFRFNVNYRLTKKISLGVNSGYRYRDADIKPTKNVNGFINFSRIPLINVSATVSANYLKTSYINGYLLRLRLNRDILPGILNLGLNYRYIDYQYNSSDNTLLQNTVQANLRWTIAKKLSCSIDFESTFEKTSRYQRVYLNFIKRF